ncbi:MAG: hypothetical protein EBV58_01280 [Actinobacteria bacterium]|nr:hypothetical protein [Actinomycetota bacterium]
MPPPGPVSPTAHTPPCAQDKEVAGSVTEKDVEEVAKIKMPDLNANDLEAAKQQVRGTARSMGLTVVG